MNIFWLQTFKLYTNIAFYYFIECTVHSFNIYLLCHLWCWCCEMVYCLRTLKIDDFLTTTGFPVQVYNAERVGLVMSCCFGLVAFYIYWHEVLHFSVCSVHRAEESAMTWNLSEIFTLKLLLLLVFGRVSNLRYSFHWSSSILLPLCLIEAAAKVSSYYTLNAYINIRLSLFFLS